MSSLWVRGGVGRNAGEGSPLLTPSNEVRDYGGGDGVGPQKKEEKGKEKVKDDPVDGLPGNADLFAGLGPVSLDEDEEEEEEEEEEKVNDEGVVVRDVDSNQVWAFPLLKNSRAIKSEIIAKCKLRHIWRVVYLKCMASPHRKVCPPPVYTQGTFGVWNAFALADDSTWRMVTHEYKLEMKDWAKLALFLGLITGDLLLFWLCMKIGFWGLFITWAIFSIVVCFSFYQWNQSGLWLETHLSVIANMALNSFVQEGLTENMLFSYGATVITCFSILIAILLSLRGSPWRSRFIIFGAVVLGVGFTWWVWRHFPIQAKNLVNNTVTNTTCCCTCPMK